MQDSLELPAMQPEEPPKPFWKRIDPFVLTILAAVIGGGLVGFLISLTSPSKTVAAWISLPGELFLRALKCVVIPLIFSNMIVGCASISGATHSTAGKIALRSVVYYMTTTVLAATQGLLWIAIFKGFFTKDIANDAPPPTSGITDTIEGRDISENLMGIFRSLAPSNIIASMANGDILGTISFALLLGVFIVRLPIGTGQRNVVLEFFFQINTVLLSIIRFIVKAAPVCVFSMIAGEFAQRPEFARVLRDLSVVILVVVMALLVHVGVVYSSIYFFILRRNPIKHLIAMLPAVLTSFATASSAVTLPITMQCVEDTLGVSPAISKFVLSLGATVNMDGTAIGLPVYIIYLAQVSGHTLDAGGWVILAIVTTLGAIGASPIPNAGLVILVSIWEAVFPGVPLPPQVSWIISIDWLLDRCETTVNVFGDSIGAVVVDHLMKQSGELDAASTLAESGSTPLEFENVARSSTDEESSGFSNIDKLRPPTIRTDV